MVEKARQLEDPVKKEAYAMIIATYMKTAFRNWNKEHYISDESIKEDLANMSKGDLKLGEEVILEASQITPRHARSKHFQKNKNNKFKKKYKPNNSNNNKRY